MVDISSGDKKINITVLTSGNKASVNATPDTAMYYSNKSREWAISDKIVDNEDYSSKYYANESKKQAQISTNKTIEVVNSGNEALSNIETAKTNAISDITNQENLSVDNVNTAGATQVNLAKEQATIATEQAGIATAKTSEVVESGNSAITAITEQETTSKNNVEAKGVEQIILIQNETSEQINNIKEAGKTEYDKIIETGIENKASINLDDLSETGEKHFLNKSQITNCILEAPNGVATSTSSSITLKKGLKVLMPNGLNTDGTLKNIEYTLLVDTVVTFSTGATADGQLILHSNGTVEVMWLTQSICAFFNLKTESEKPTATIPARAICFVKDTNKHYLTTDNGSTWTEILCCSNVVQDFNVGNDVLTAFDANKPISLASTNSDNLFTGYNTFMPNRGNLNTDAFSIVIPKAMTEQKTTHGNILFKNFDNASVCLMSGSQYANGHSAVRILGFHPTNGWRTLFYADTTQDTAWVVEKYSNGQSWYRKWSDGWVEQGGVVGRLSETAFTTVSLLVPVQQSTASYSISLTGGSLMTGNNVASAFGYMDVGTDIKLAISDFGGAVNNVACFQVWGVMA